jgi:hypothetical protein
LAEYKLKELMVKDRKHIQNYSIEQFKNFQKGHRLTHHMDSTSKRLSHIFSSAIFFVHVVICRQISVCDFGVTCFSTHAGWWWWWNCGGIGVGVVVVD